MAAALGEAGFTLVSGLARGVDGAVHCGSLQTGTAAVPAGGVDQPYPPQHLKLDDAICEQGVVVSEAPFGAVARALGLSPQQPHHRWAFARGCVG